VSRWLRWLSAGLAALLLLAVLAWAWLWHSNAGRDFVLAQARNALADGALRWDHAEGALADGVRLEGVVLQVGSRQIRIAQMHAAVSPAALWHGVLRVAPLRLDDVRIQRASMPTDGVVEPFVWPSQWPVLPLPLAIEVPALDVRGLQWQRADAAPQRISTLDGGLRLASDEVRITALTLARPEDSVRIDGRIGLGARSHADLQLRGAAAATSASAWQLQARVTGRPADLQLVLDGRAPGPVSLRARIRHANDRLRWQLNGRVQDLAPAAFGGPEGRFGAALDIDGIDDVATLSGHLQRDQQTLRILPSQLRWQDQQIHLSPLVLAVLGGELRVSGTVGIGGDAPVMALSVAGDGLRWGAGRGAIAASGSATVQGTLGQWLLDGRAELQRDASSARIALRAHGDQRRATLDHLRLNTAAGQSQLSGELAFAPAWRWQLAGVIREVDPGFFAPQFPGALSANLASTGAVDGGRVQFTAALEALRGQLRGRAVSGRARLEHDAGRSAGSLEVQVGSSHVRASGEYVASGKRPVSIRAQFSPLRLHDLLPDARGSVNGELALSGTIDSATVRGELHGEHLAWGDVAVDALRLQATPSAPAGTRMALTLDRLRSGPWRLARLQADAEGALASARWSLHATADAGEAEAAGVWQHGKRGRAVALHRLVLTPIHGDRWRLADPATLTLNAAIALSPLCLAQGQSRLCAQGHWPGQARLSAQAVDLALLDPLLRGDAVQFGLDGQVDGDATLRSNAGRLTDGTARLQFSPGAVQVIPRGKQAAFVWRGMTLDASLHQGRIVASLVAQTGADRVLRGQLQAGLDADSPLSGELNLDVAQLAWLELFTPYLAAPSGRLRGHVGVGGSRAAPQLSGQLSVQDFSGELPALGIALRNSSAHLSAVADGMLTLSAQLDTGEGVLHIDGESALGGDAPLTLRIVGERVKVSDTAELTALISPKLTVQHADGGLSINGDLSVPQARIALDKRQAGAAARSADVVVLDPIEPEPAQPGMAVALDVQASFGKAVALTGFGLDGKLTGDLNVAQVPGHEPLGTGTLNVSGSYQRHGKPLTLRRARLSYTRSPLDNPALDIRAERRIDQQMVGVQVSGDALQPITTLVSEPALDSSETLSWLVLGRPLRAAQQGDSAKLDAAASALGAGGNLLAEQLGARLGLDQAALGESRTLGLNTLSVGKFVSPRLYVSYGVSLLGVGQVVALKYLLGGGFEVEIESGLESRGSLNWRTER